MSETTTQTTTIYGEGGWKPDEKGENIVCVYEQDYDTDGNPIGDPRVLEGELP